MIKSLIIDISFKYKRIALLEDSELTELIVEEKNDVLPNNIYIAKVQKILKNKFVFFELEENKIGFLSLTDISEKALYDEKTQKLKIKQGDYILVQVKKQGADKKASLVTSNISIIGKYLILNLNSKNINISKKIQDYKIRKNLEDLVKNLLPKAYGIIVRTKACDINKLKIEEELNYLIKKANQIQEKSSKIKSPSLVYSFDDEAYNIITNILNYDDKVYINNKEEYGKLKYKTNFENIHLYEEKQPIFDNFYIEKQISKIFNNKIWLKSGGYIVINYVEAMTIIDVNSGKNTKKNRENMILNTNLEAVKEVFKQIRLRNISGIIVIDFIDMENIKDYNLIYKEAESFLQKDRVSIKIFPVTELGLMQLTRKKTRKPLRSIFMCKCPACDGVGYVKNEEYVALEIKNTLLTLCNCTNYTNFKVESNRKVIEALSSLNIKKFEEKYKKEIELKVIQTAKLDYYNIGKYCN